jgi:hypothetical protein
MSETPLDESLNPIWVLLAKGESPNLWLPPPGGKDWASSLRSASASLGNEELIVSVGRPLARSALSRLSGRGGLPGKGPSPTEMTEAFEEERLEVVATYGLWPSARSPRIAFPWGHIHMLYWLQTSGVLGGGGNRLWARILARSVLFTPVAAAIAPGIAFIVRRTQETTDDR